MVARREPALPPVTRHDLPNRINELAEVSQISHLPESAYVSLIAETRCPRDWTRANEVGNTLEVALRPDLAGLVITSR